VPSGRPAAASSTRNYPSEKAAEKRRAEALDVILIETLEEHPDEHVLEVDTTGLSFAGCADRIERFIRENCRLPTGRLTGPVTWDGAMTPTSSGRRCRASCSPW
jgi:broad-specificity NMP kinase